MTVTRNFWDGLAIALVASLPLWVAIIATVRGLLALVL